MHPSHISVSSSIDCMMPAKVILLTGAPQPSSLRWDDSELLNDSLPSFLNDSRCAAERVSSVQWRILGSLNDLSYNSARKRVNVLDEDSSSTQMAMERYSGNSASLNTEDVLSEFYNHSFAIHEDISCSLESGSESSWTQSHDETSFWDKSTEDSIAKQPNQISPNNHTSLAPMPGHVSDVGDIPNVAY